MLVIFIKKSNLINGVVLSWRTWAVLNHDLARPPQHQSRAACVARVLGLHPHGTDAVLLLGDQRSEPGTAGSIRLCRTRKMY